MEGGAEEVPGSSSRLAHPEGVEISSIPDVAITAVALPRVSAGLAVRDVAHSFGDRVALDGVSFDVAPGVLTGLLGPNGAGETTVIRVMLGVLTPNRGEVRRDGDPVDQNVRRRWGYMRTGSLSRDAGW